MLNNLPTKANIIYGVGIPATVEVYQDDNFYSKTSTELKTLFKLQNKFTLLKQSLAINKELLSKRELTVIDYSQVLIGLASRLLTRNLLTYTDRRDELNQLGIHVKKIRNAVDYSKVIEVGTLCQFYSKGSDLFNSVEGTLKNYYNSLNLDFTLSPKAKHDEIIKRLNLDTINWNFVNTELVNTFKDNNLKNVQKANLITVEDIVLLKVKFTLLLISESEFNYYKYLEVNNKIETKLISLFYSVLQFDLVGSIPRFYLALLVESLLTAAIYIKTIPDSVAGVPLGLFLEELDYLEYKNNLANYFRLASEITYILSRFKILKEMEELNKVITKDYIKLTQYLYNKEIEKDYSLIEYYAGI